MMRSGWRFCIADTKSFEQGGVWMVVSRSSATSTRLDAGIGEFLHDLVFFFRHPGAVPVFGQRVDVGLLAGDPLLVLG